MALVRVAALDAVPVGTPTHVDVEGRPVCLVRFDDTTVKAIHDVCSHQQYPLHEGYVDDNEIECALHGSTFDLDSGDPQGLPAVRPVPVYTATVADDSVYVDVEEQLNDAPVPRH